ncbi:unnamed protein product [Closterium sp. NIES-64]|nr:unnamed protein product [Closterium sp. NIES-64]
MSKCDAFHLGKDSRNVALQDADRMVGQFQEFASQIEEIIGGGDVIPAPQVNQLKRLKRRKDALLRKWAVRDTLKYFWKVPESDADGQGGGASGATNGSSRSCGAPWEQFSPEKFCEVMDKRTMLIVGDSLNLLLADAIRFNVRLGANANAKDQEEDSAKPRVQWGEPTAYCQRYQNATKKKDPRCWTLHLCADLGFSVRVFFVRDYYLNSTEDVNDFLLDRSFDESWMDEIAAQNVSMVVINRGAHYIEDERFERQLQSTLLALRQAHPELLIIARNTPAGHPGCWLHRKPLSKKLLELPHDDWHWDGFAAQNGIVRRLVEGVGGVYMDVNASTRLRVFGGTYVAGDGHVGRWDCLHYCHPGPVDAWVQLLFNLPLGLLVPLAEMLRAHFWGGETACTTAIRAHRHVGAASLQPAAGAACS